MGNKVADEILMHYGIAKRSGRYPWGSGDDPYQHSGDFLSRIETLKKEGMSDTAIAKSMGLTSTQFRTQRTMANDERRNLEYNTAKGLREKGHSLNDIATKIGYKNESSVRSLLDENAAVRMLQAKTTADFLKNQVDEKNFIVLGTGVERELGISKEKLTQSTYMLQMDGYEVYKRRMGQVTNPGKFTTLTVLCKPGTEYKEIYNDDNLNSLLDYKSRDGGDTFTPTFVYPKSMDSNRVAIRYAEDGGVHKDGVVELRRGVDDISLGESRYAQVRILVDDKKYIKGMAVYGDDKDFAPGVDIIFNTNKHKDVAKLDVLKKIHADPDNPFGSLIKSPGGQSYYTDKNGKQQLSLINKRAEEGDWDEWSNKLPSQFLAKQNLSLIKNQLALTTADKKAEFDEINSLDNPTLKKTLLKSFADDCDAAAVHLKSAALPGQRYQVILPLNTIKDNEVYAPNFENGAKVALVRFPHGGTFEIPILTVNNKNKEAIRVLGSNPKDAVGINSKNAERLSGADFDGDTVMVVPTGGKVNITSTPALKGLEGFDNKMSYGYDEVRTTKEPDKKGVMQDVNHYYKNGKEYKVMKNTQTEMGKISNLITDMTLKAASTDELAKAVRHSMVVIDAEKHHLDYKKSYEENGIVTLKKRYQGVTEEDGRYHEGAGTLLSRSKSQLSVDKKRGQPWINAETGAYEWERVNPKTGEFESKIVREEYIDKDGKTKVRMQESTKMYETKDARTLSSGTPQEEAYADYANQMKALGNAARKSMITTGKIDYSPDANREYKEEVNTLLSKVNVVLKNAPRERQAQILANAAVSAKKQANTDMTKAEIKKANQQELTRARDQVGAKRTNIEITDREWEAIQSGAITENKLKQIIDNIDTDVLKQRAMPRTTTTLSTAKINKIESMIASGYSTNDIAKSIGVSSSTILKYV